MKSNFGSALFIAGRLKPVKNHPRLRIPVVWIVQPLSEKQARHAGREIRMAGNGFELYVREPRSIRSSIRSQLFSLRLTEQVASMESDARGRIRLL